MKQQREQEIKNLVAKMSRGKSEKKKKKEEISHKVGQNGRNRRWEINDLRTGRSVDALTV